MLARVMIRCVVLLFCSFLSSLYCRVGRTHDGKDMKVTCDATVVPVSEDPRVLKCEPFVKMSSWRARERSPLITT